VSGASVLKCVPEGEDSMSVIACISACEELVRGPTQMVDGFILVTAPVPLDAAYEARSAFCERPSRARLCAGSPVREPCVSKETVAWTAKMATTR